MMFIIKGAHGIHKPCFRQGLLMPAGKASTLKWRSIFIYLFILNGECRLMHCIRHIKTSADNEMRGTVRSLLQQHHIKVETQNLIHIN